MGYGAKKSIESSETSPEQSMLFSKKWTTTVVETSNGSFHERLYTSGASTKKWIIPKLR
jgi:hypothetical protein